MLGNAIHRRQEGLQPSRDREGAEEIGDDPLVGGAGF